MTTSSTYPFWPTLLYTLTVLSVMYIAAKLLRWISTRQLSRWSSLSSGEHHWTHGGLFLPLYCSICGSILVGGTKGTEVGSGKVRKCTSSSAAATCYLCSDCGLATCLEAKCLRSATKEVKCKEVSRSKDGAEGDSSTSFVHHWVSGNLPLMSECEVCEQGCGDSTQDEDLRCAWCQRTVHKACQPRFGDVCDLGGFAEFIVPPSHVFAKAVAGSRRNAAKSKKFNVVKVTRPERPTRWNPLIVIGNSKSGNNDGSAFLNSFRGQLNPLQVVDLGQSKMEDALRLCQAVAEGCGGSGDGDVPECIVLVAGGDGTIGWTLNTIDALRIDPEPILALLPLGTGNDLARTLGYGAGGDHDDVRALLSILKTRTRVQRLDRWMVTLSPLPTNAAAGHKQPKSRWKMKGKELYMQNYFSIGVDALVTYNFHKARENASGAWGLSGRLFNKLLYFVYGTKDVLERECQDLDRLLEVKLDGREVELPNLESLVVLNIPSWGAGVRPWELGSGHEFGPVRVDDRRLEVFAVYSSFHIAQMQVGLSEPHRLGQASSVTIRLLGRAPMQSDGEPWIQDPAEIKVKFHKAVSVLKVVR